jgi:hypothetical protein
VLHAAAGFSPAREIVPGARAELGNGVDLAEVNKIVRYKLGQIVTVYREAATTSTMGVIIRASLSGLVMA